MPKVAVRRINEWDGPAMLKIYSLYTGTTAAPEPEPPALAEYIQRIDKYTYGLGWLMCEIDSVPAGFCHLTEDRNASKDLFSVEFQLYVKPEFQRLGVGRALWTLMRDMMEYGSRRQVSVRVDGANREALDFFTAMGFVPSGTDREKGREIQVLRYELTPRDPEIDRPVKPYLLDNLDYERLREAAARLVRVSREK